MNHDFGLTEEDISTITQILKKYPEIENAYIFGSRAKGNYKNGSDIDIALKGAALNSNIILEISYILNEETIMPYNFDILNYHTINNINLIEHINRVGVELYKKDD